MNPMSLDAPHVVAEVRRHFEAYERAFMANDAEALVGFFWADPRLTRYGIADRQFGIDEMRAYRLAQPAPAFTRRIENLRVTAFGNDMAFALAEFVRSDTPLRGFQSQTWVRFDGPVGWRIVAAHVSMIPFEAGSS